MWHNHPFSQKTKQQKEQWGWRLEATGKGGWIKFENRVQAKQRGVFIKQGVRNPQPTILQFLFNLLHAGKHNLAYCITFVTLLYCNNCQLFLLKLQCSAQHFTHASLTYRYFPLEQNRPFPFLHLQLFFPFLPVLACIVSWKLIHIAFFFQLITMVRGAALLANIWS